MIGIPRRPRRFAPVALALAAVAWAGSGRAQQWSRPGSSEWEPEVRKVVEKLREHRWKAARRNAESLADEVMRSSWYGPGLGHVLAELALARAVADANLGRDRQAIWHYHAATNLDFRIRTRDLAPYGEAAKLLYEHKLRARGETPAGFENRETTPLVRFERPQPPDMKTTPTILNNTASTREGSSDFHVEVIVGKEGKLHHPVVVSDYVHPIVTYAVLRWLEDLPPFEPGRVEGEPTDSLYDLVVDFKIGRW